MTDQDSAYYFTDPADAVKVWICVPSEDANEYDDTANDYREDDPNYESRMQAILVAIAAAVRAEFPNATDLWIIDGGTENQYSPFFPSRIEDEDGRVYEYSGEAIDDIVDNASAEAWTKYPAREPEAIAAEQEG